MPKHKDFLAGVKAVARTVDRTALAAELAKRVKVAALTKPRPQPKSLWLDESSMLRWKQASALPLKKQRRARRHSYKFQRYTVSDGQRFNTRTVRRNTFRRYMLETIQAHGDTRAATEAHLAGGRFPDNRLDFGWAADNGYITFVE